MWDDNTDGSGRLREGTGMGDRGWRFGAVPKAVSSPSGPLRFRNLNGSISVRADPRDPRLKSPRDWTRPVAVFVSGNRANYVPNSSRWQSEFGRFRRRMAGISAKRRHFSKGVSKQRRSSRGFRDS